MSFYNPLRPKPLTYRVENIPFGTTKETLKNQFYNEDQEGMEVISLVPAVDTPEQASDGDLTATVIFRSEGNNGGIGPRDVSHNLSIDRDFHGFTPLYVPKTAPIVADIIAVTGLAGHAYGSWAHSPEKMWLRDYLPVDAPNARILTYGYPSKLQNSNSQSILADHTNTFIHRLIDMRETGLCESRPIIFIGHSLGCLIIKKALTDVGLMGLNISRLPVRAIVFLGAPHRGLNMAGLATLVKGKPTQVLIDELRAGSPTLRDLNARFAQIARDVDILTFYETQPTRTAVEAADGVWRREGPLEMMVSQDSAQQFSPREKLIAVDLDHSKIAKVNKGQNGIYPNIKSAIRHALLTNARIVATAADGLTIGQGHHIPAENESSRFANSLSMPTPPSSSPSPIPHMETLSMTSAAQPNTGIPRRALTTRKKRLSTILHNQSAEKLPQKDQNHSTEEDATEANETDRSNSRTSIKDRGNSLVLSQAKQDSALSLKLEISEYDSEIVKALKSGNSSRLANLAQPSTINQQDDKGILPLVFAAQFGLEQGLEVLLNHGASPNLRDGDNITPLIAAIKGNHRGVVDILMRHRASIDTAGGWDEYSPLHYAIQEKNSGMIEKILEHKPILASFNTDRQTPLFMAVDENNEDAVRLLLAAGADTESKNTSNGKTPLMQAGMKGYTDIVEMLIKGGADVNARSLLNANTALILTAEKGNLEAVKILLREGAEVNVTTNSKKFSPLSTAATKGHAAVIDTLIQAGADIDAVVEPVWETALMKGARWGHLDVVDLLLRRGADPNKAADPDPKEFMDFQYSTALTSASAYGNLDVVKRLLNYKAKVNESLPPHHSTALLWAARYGHEEVVRYLVEEGADVDAAIRPSGITPLIYAAEYGHNECVEILIENEADSSMKTSPDDESALLRAVSYEHGEVVETLLTYEGVDDEEGARALVLAVEKGDVKIVGLLLEASVDPNSRDDESDVTALGIACSQGDVDVARELIKHDANIECENDYGEGLGRVRPLYIAAHFGHVDIVKLLLMKGANSSAKLAGLGRKKWDKMSFDDEVAFGVQREILGMLEHDERITGSGKIKLKFWK